MENATEEVVLDDYQISVDDMFDELSFKEKWSKVKFGLKQPKNTGHYKWAKLQVIRLSAPIAAVAVPIIILGLITILAAFTPEPSRTITIRVAEPEPMEQIEEIIIPEPEILQPPEVTDIQVEVYAESPSLPSEVITPPADVASVQPSLYDSVAITKSPVIMKSMLGSRSPGARGAALGKYGAPGGTSPAVIRALRWLAKTQSTDGSWGKDKPAMTALSLLAFLAHGETPASEEFGQTVEYALKFLLEAQDSSGRFKGRDNHDYTQPIVAYALAEASGMIPVPAIKEAAIKAIQIVINGQNPSGSFNYNLKPTTRNDLSYAAWCVQALKAAKIAGLEYTVNGLDEAMKKSITGVKWHYGEKNGYGGFHYASSGIGGLTGAGILCLQFLDEGKSREVRSSMPTMAQYPFNWDSTKTKGNIYYWYYNTQAYFQEGGEAWKKWNAEFSAPLIKEQKIFSKTESGYVDHKGIPHETGLWEGGPTGHTGGNSPTMDTILSTLMLTTYFRYLPTTQRVAEAEIQKELGNSNDIQIEIF